VSGRRPQEIVYADDTVVGFLCEPPATWGHVLIVPRRHRADIWDVPPQEAESVIATQATHSCRAACGACRRRSPDRGDEEKRRVVETIRRGIAARRA